jgi:hypothetical protein
MNILSGVRLTALLDGVLDAGRRAVRVLGCDDILATKSTTNLLEPGLHTGVNSNVLAVDGVTTEVEVVVSSRQLVGAAGEVDLLAVVEGASSVLDVAQFVGLGVGGGDASSLESLFSSH